MREILILQHYYCTSLNLPHLLSILPRAQDVKDSVGAVGEHNVASVIQLNEDVVLGLLGTKFEVQHSVHAQLLHIFQPLVAQVFPQLWGGCATLKYLAIIHFLN